MIDLFKPSIRFARGEEIYEFNHDGKLERTTAFVSRRCPSCHRYEHNFVIDNMEIWCCPNESCMDQRLNNSGINSTKFPLNYLRHLKKRNKFSNAVMEKEGPGSDFYEKWVLFRNGKIKDIIVQGDMGVGKTHAMHAALKQVCKEASYLSTMFLTETELYEKIKNTYSHETKCSEQEVVKRISSVDVLFLDDMGSATRSSQGEWSKQILLDILDERLNSLNCRTIISTNLPLEDLPKIYDSRIGDRLKFMKQVFMKGDSRRKPIESSKDDDSLSATIVN